MNHVVSVIINNYNYARFPRQAIDRALGQGSFRKAGLPELANQLIINLNFPSKDG
jgi:hypothetical protein